MKLLLELVLGSKYNCNNNKHEFSIVVVVCSLPFTQRKLDTFNYLAIYNNGLTTKMKTKIALFYFTSVRERIRRPLAPSMLKNALNKTSKKKKRSTSFLLNSGSYSKERKRALYAKQNFLPITGLNRNGEIPIVSPLPGILHLSELIEQLLSNKFKCSKTTHWHRLDILTKILKNLQDIHYRLKCIFCSHSFDVY